jgi:hypothetical protein
MKVAIIAIAKNENLYINEWVNHHLNLGFDNIIICDNDDELILPSVVTDDRVIIEDYTTIYGVQQIAYRETFKKYRDKFDWIFFIDIDEFLVLEKHNNVKDFLSTFPEKVQCVKLCWKHFSDNEELDVIDGNYNVFDRFKTVVETKMDNMVKAFIKTNIPEELIDRITQHSIFCHSIYSVDALNNENGHGKFLNKIVHEIAWVNHYRTKTIGEFIRQKYFRGGPNRNNVKYRNLRYFFETNKKTDEKVAYAEKLIKEIKK